MLEDPIQKLETSKCGPFQLYFFDNVFNPGENSHIQKHNKLTKKTIETLVNEIFTLDQEQNKKQIQQYIEQINIRLE